MILKSPWTLLMLGTGGVGQSPSEQLVAGGWPNVPQLGLSAIFDDWNHIKKKNINHSCGIVLASRQEISGEFCGRYLQIHAQIHPGAPEMEPDFLWHVSERHLNRPIPSVPVQFVFLQPVKRDRSTIHQDLSGMEGFLMIFCFYLSLEVALLRHMGQWVDRKIDGRCSRWPPRIRWFFLEQPPLKVLFDMSIMLIIFFWGVW